MENFIHFHLFTSIIFSILLVIVLGNATSLSPLNSTYIMEARERFMSLDLTKLPDPPMPSYSFTIYHCDIFEKSKFKDYDSLLENRLARSHARASYLASIHASKNGVQGGGDMLKLVPISTDTYYNGEYVASFLIGSQKIKNYLLINTGSDFVWWQCGPCEPNKCYHQDQTLYNSSASETFQKIHCDQCKINDPAFICDLENFMCKYNVRLVDGISSVHGFMASEVIIFVLDQVPVSIMFGCSKQQVGISSATFSGFVGLARAVPGGYSLPSQFGGNLMAMCLPSDLSGKGSALSFHTSMFSRTTLAKLLLNHVYPSNYYVNLYKVFVNDRWVPVSPSWWNFKGDMTGGVMVDTGIAVTHFPHDFYIVFREIFRMEVQPDYSLSEYPVDAFDTCYVSPDNIPLYFPVVKLYFGSVNSGNELVLTQERVIVRMYGLYCLAFMGWKHDLSILGVHQLQRIGLTFDTSANTLSFDIDACD